MATKKRPTKKRSSKPAKKSAATSKRSAKSARSAKSMRSAKSTRSAKAARPARRGPRSAAQRVSGLLVMLPWIMQRQRVKISTMARQFNLSEAELV
ncbi:MAG: hypothetical protein ACKOQU_00420, partial [Acidimicrobiaceae bacterium]